jgi:hypothetical protein
MGSLRPVQNVAMRDGPDVEDEAAMPEIFVNSYDTLPRKWSLGSSQSFRS